MERYLAMSRIPMPVSKIGPLATLMVVLIGCGADSGGSLADSFEPPEACSFPPGPSRWAGGSYRETARAGNTEDVWFASIGGVHWADDELYVFDMGNARVVRLTSDLAYVGSFGREGDGPGEFLKWRLPGGVPWRRLHGSNGLLVVFDEGRRVSLFDAKGNFRENLISDPAGAGMSITIRGVRLTPYGLFFDWSGQYAPDRPPVRADSVP